MKYSVIWGTVSPSMYKRQREIEIPEHSLSLHQVQTKEPLHLTDLKQGWRN